MDWGCGNLRFLGLVYVGAARSLDQTALRPSVIKRVRQMTLKDITHMQSVLKNSNVHTHKNDKIIWYPLKMRP